MFYEIVNLLKYYDLFKHIWYNQVYESFVSEIISVYVSLLFLLKMMR